MCAFCFGGPSDFLFRFFSDTCSAGITACMALQYSVHGSCVSFRVSSATTALSNLCAWCLVSVLCDMLSNDCCPAGSGSGKTWTSGMHFGVTLLASTRTCFVKEAGL